MKEFIDAVLLARDKGMIDNKEARELIRGKFNFFDKSDPSPAGNASAREQYRKSVEQARGK